MIRLQSVRLEVALEGLNLGPRRREYGYMTSYTPPDPTISRIIYGSVRLEF